MPYRRILVGTDGSASAEKARQLATHLAKKLKSELDVVTASQRGAPPNVGLGTRLVTGDPAEVLMMEAEATSADLIVVGNVGMGGAKRFTLGGVPDRVSHEAKCDVLIARTLAANASVREGGYRRILIGTDGSVSAFDAARRGFDLATSIGAKASFIFVGPKDPGEHIVAETARQLGGQADVDSVVVEGDPAVRICQEVENGDYDLVVTGNKGMSGASRFILGSVPNKVSHGASSDVLIVQTKQRRIEDIPSGEGGIVSIDGRTVAAYKEEGGRTHLLSARCQHMGCTVKWNSHDKTWDCPCHGSRYRPDGELLDGPATRGLPKAGS